MSIQQTITYGTATFPFARLAVAEETVFSPNGIDVIGTAFTFSISGWISGTDQADFASKLNLMKGNLAQSRLLLSVQWDSGVTLWSFGSGASNDADIDWGPKPSSVNFGPFLGGRACLYSCQIRVIVKECWTCSSSTCSFPGTRPTEVLSVTRRMDFNVDANGQTTRTTTGTLICTSQGVPADQFRRYTIVPVPNWYRRDSMTFSQSENGRELNYTIVDREVAYTLPNVQAGITSGRATYTVKLATGLNPGSSSAGALGYHYNLSGEFSAPVDVPSSDIIAEILQLALDKFPTSSSDIGLIPLEREFSEEIYESNTIRFSMSAWSATGSGSDPWDISTGIATFGLKPTNTTGQSKLIGIYGGDPANAVTSGVLGATPVVYDACFPGTNPTPGGTGGTIGGSGGASGAGGYQGGNGHGGPGTEAATSNAGATSEHLSAPYWDAHEEILWEIDNGWKVFDPKVGGVAPIKQRIRPPRIMIYQVGYITRDVTTMVDSPMPFDPIYDAAKATMIRSFVHTETPIPIGTGGWNRVTINYGYKMRIMKAMTTGLSVNDVDMAIGGYSTDPRVGPVTGAPPSTLPDQLLDTSNLS